jgi:hypothetical protein
MQVFLYDRAALYSTLWLMRSTVDQTNVQPTTDQPTSKTTDKRLLNRSTVTSTVGEAAKPTVTN